MNCLSISVSLKQLSKVLVQWYSQEYLFGKFLQIIIKVFVTEFIFSEILCFQNILLNTFRLVTLSYENYSFEGSYFRHSNNIQVAA